jgi:hypothetical protein
VWLSATRGAVDRGVYVARGRIAARLNGHVEDICSAHGIGAADLEPAMVAIACALWMGLAPDVIGATLARCLVLEAAERPAGLGMRLARGSVRSLLRDRARALFGHPADAASRETEPAATGAR